MNTGLNRRFIDWNKNRRWLGTDAGSSIVVVVTVLMLAGCGPSLTSSDYARRIAAVNLVNDPAILAKVANEDPHAEVKKAAIARLSDQTILTDIVLRGDPTSEVWGIALAKITDQALLEKIVTTPKDNVVTDAKAFSALKEITDHDFLMNLALAKDDKSPNLPENAERQITDPQLLARLARESSDTVTRQDAVTRITDESLLETIAVDPKSDVRRAAVLKLTNQALLEKLALEDKDPVIAFAAIQTVTDQPFFLSLTKSQDAGLRQSAAEALKDKTSLLSLALGDPDTNVRQAACNSLGKLADPTAAAPLSGALPNWDLNNAIGSALKKMNWQPTSESDQVYYWISTQDGTNLKAQWDQTKRVLLADVQSGDQHKIENSVYTFVSLGSTEVIPQLTQILNANGNQQMAVTFLNCGSPDLETAARAWCQTNGYEVEKTHAGVHTNASWGKWK